VRRPLSFSEADTLVAFRRRRRRSMMTAIDYSRMARMVRRKEPLPLLLMMEECGILNTQDTDRDYTDEYYMVYYGSIPPRHLPSIGGELIAIAVDC
jgi:hypothetical protein